MQTLFTLACLLACLLVAINQIRIVRRMEEVIVPAINQCNKDLERVEKLLAIDDSEDFVEYVALPDIKRDTYLAVDAAHQDERRAS